VNKTAAEGMLRSEFDSGDYPIVAVSTVGYGNMAQRRDKHNLFGVGVGGRIDLYVRNFSDLYSVTKTVYGRLDGVSNGGGTYKLTLSPADFPGGCWVKSVADPFASGSSSESDEPESEQVLQAAAEGMELPLEEAAAVFEALFIMVHGYASLIANNAMPYDPASIAETLQTVAENFFEKGEEE
jgi:hypothetical protein